ncbi:MAG TPA: polyhydroxyalkanoate synthesis repressor PhaR [Rugosibacter sp.]|jgi:polyhydroxyalkanoate synthesis repressor PhaR|nr:polyhydroxyalkanoate synthesis repressor PhaR [Rugosibacter sp.]HQN46306.1 polyhydroxyalkanoate synthesis repressor PhaR [Rugosibacter sp.]HQQ34750.1 polyhydroxyalkanoate synthesis repressor PhaR [Rugosibacter sp.]
MVEQNKTETYRTIKKYPNRRLYDTQTSSYITLADVKALVLAHEAFLVVDAKSEEDLTRAILLQIILEEEAGGAPMFSSEMLSQMIRFYGSAMQSMMGRYLDSNMKAFVDMQAKFSSQVVPNLAKPALGMPALGSPEMWNQFLNFQGPAMQNMMNTYVEQSQQLFQQMQDQVKEQTRKIFPDAAKSSEAKPRAKKAT